MNYLCMPRAHIARPHLVNGHVFKRAEVASQSLTVGFRVIAGSLIRPLACKPAHSNGADFQGNPLTLSNLGLNALLPRLSLAASVKAFGPFLATIVSNTGHPTNSPTFRYTFLHRHGWYTSCVVMPIGAWSIAATLHPPDLHVAGVNGWPFFVFYAMLGMPCMANTSRRILSFCLRSSPLMRNASMSVQSPRPPRVSVIPMA